VESRGFANPPHDEGAWVEMVCSGVRVASARELEAGANGASSDECLLLPARRMDTYSDAGQDDWSSRTTPAQ
jgi:hypothetical protein